MSDQTTVQTTNQINNINQIPLHPQNSNPYNYIDVVIGSQIIQQLSKFNSKNAFTLTNVSILIATLSLWEIKGGVSCISKEIFEFAKLNYKPLLLGMYNGLGSLYSRLKESSLVKCNEDEFISNQPVYPTEVYNKNVYHVKTIVEYIESLIYFLHFNHTANDATNTTNPTNPTNTTNTTNILVNFDKSCDKNIEYVNMKNYKITETYRNISIQYKGIELKIKDELSIVFNVSENNKKIDKLIPIQQQTPTKSQHDYATQLAKINKNNIMLVYQLMDDPVLSAYLENIVRKNGGFITSNFDVIKNYQAILDVKPEKRGYPNCISQFETNEKKGVWNFERFTLLVLKYHYPNLVLPTSLSEIITIYSLLSITKTNMIKNNTLLFFDIELSIPSQMKTIYDYDNFKKLDNILRYTYETILISPTITLGGYINKNNVIINKAFVKINGRSYSQYSQTNFDHGIHDFGEMGKIDTRKSVLGLNPDITDEPTTKPPTDTNTNADKGATITIECSGLDSEDELDKKYNEFNKYMNSLSNINDAVEAEILIHRISLKITNKEETIPNPKYAEYEEKKQMIMEMSGDGNNDDNGSKGNKSSIDKLMKIQIPNKTITKITVEKNVLVEPVNQGRKSMDTLYLKKMDETKLNSVVSTFHSKKEFLKSMGLPNKCCILLHGLPGTGKSSAILTIASYLKKNIYYVSFQQVKTNSELQMIVDHVIKNCNGGIIVAEDIDAIGTLVHRRSDFVEIKAFPDSGNLSALKTLGFSSLNTTNIMDTKEESITLEYLLNLLQGTITPDGLIFIATTNHLDVLDPAFYRDGRFDLKIQMTECDEYQLNKIYKKFIGRTIPEKYMNKLVSQKITPATFIFTIKDYICDETMMDECILSRFL